MPPYPIEDHQDHRRGVRTDRRHRHRGDAQDDRAGRDPAGAGLATERESERRNERPDAGRGHQEPVARGAAGEVVCREGRDENAEIHTEGGHTTDDEDGQQDERRVPDVVETLHEVLHDRTRGPGSGDPGRGAELRLVEHQQRDDDREEAEGVDRERGSDAERGDREAGQRRPDDPRPVEHRRVEGHGVADVLAPDELDREGLSDRHVDGDGATRAGSPARRIIQTSTRPVTVSTVRMTARAIITTWVATSVWRFGGHRRRHRRTGRGP